LITPYAEGPVLNATKSNVDGVPINKLAAARRPTKISGDGVKKIQ